MVWGNLSTLADDFLYLSTANPNELTVDANQVLNMGLNTPLYMYESLVNIAKSILPQVLNYLGTSNPTEILIGGHSLGGGLAHIIGSSLVFKHNVSVITYNGPYLGTPDMYNTLNTFMPKHYKFHMQYDAVTCGTRNVFNSGKYPKVIQMPADFTIDPAYNNSTTGACLQIGNLPETYQFFWSESYYDNMSWEEWALWLVMINFQTLLIEYSQTAAQHSIDFIARREKVVVWSNLLKKFSF